MMVITKVKRSVAEFNEMIEQKQVCVQSHRDYPVYDDAVVYQLRDSIEAELLCKTENDVRFQTQQQHPRMEIEKDLLLSERMDQVRSAGKCLKESPDSEFMLRKEQEEKGEWELIASERQTT